MENLTEKNDSQIVLERFDRYKNSATQWRQNISDDISFVTPGGMWTQEQINDLQARGQAPIEIPIITPQVELQKANIINQQLKFKLIPRSDTDERKAKLMSELCSYMWDYNDGDVVIDDVVTNQLICGKGYIYVSWDPEADDGYGAVIMSSVHPLFVIVDPNSKRRDEEDAVAKYVYGYFSKHDAVIKYPQYAEFIEEASHTTKELSFSSVYPSHSNVELYDNISDPGDDLVLIVEEFTKTSLPFYIVKYNDGENVAERELSEEEFEQLSQELAGDQELQANIQQVVKRWRTRVVRKLVIGTELIETEILPTEWYPVIPVSYRHFGNPYPISLVRYMRGLQTEVNHRRSLMIAHATASLNNKVLLPRGSVSDIEKFEVDWGRPNAVLEYDMTYGAPTIVAVQPLSNAYFELEMAAKHDAEFIAGSFSISHGDPTAAPETRGATIMLNEWSTKRTTITARYLYSAIKILGKVMVNFIQHYMKQDRVIRLVNPYAPWEEKTIQVGIGNAYSGEEIELLGDPSVGRYDVAILTGSIVPYVEKAQQTMEQQQAEIESLTKSLKEVSAKLEEVQSAYVASQERYKYEKRRLDLEAQYQKKMLDLEEQISNLKQKD